MSDDRTQIAGSGSAVKLGTELNQTYRIDQLIGVGGMGEVFKGHNIQTGDPVAIKIVLPEFARDEMILELFRKEARILNHLAHDAIVRYYVFSIERSIGRPYLAMEFVDGPSLADHAKKAPLAAQDIILLLRRLADGLHKAHEAGIIHRDMSPDNVILPSGVVANAKIIDFGIARSANVGGATLLGGSFAGKYNYVSPEQLGLFGGEVTPKSDMYSLALVMAAAARGYPLQMSGSQVEVIEKRREVPDLSDVPKQLHGVLTAMLQPDPANRPQSMAEVRDWDFGGKAAAKPAQGKKGSAKLVSAARSDPPQVAASQSNAMRNSVIAAGALAVIAVGALGGWIFVRGQSGSGTSASTQQTATVASDLPGTAASEDAQAKPANEGQSVETSPADIKPADANSAESSIAGDSNTTFTVPPDATPADGGTARSDASPQQAGSSQQQANLPPGTIKTPTVQSPATSGVGDLQTFASDFGRGSCFSAEAVSISADAAKLSVIGTQETASAFKTAFRSKAGFDPALEVNQVTPEQCQLLSLLSKIPETADKPVAIKLERADIRPNNEQLKIAGDGLNFIADGIGDRIGYVFFITDLGQVFNIKRLRPNDVSQLPDQLVVRTSVTSDAAPAEGEAQFRPILVLVIASPRPLLKIESQDAFEPEDFASAINQDLGAANGVSRKLTYVRLMNK